MRVREWWENASDAQRIEQIRHAIEIRLTCGETAKLLGTTHQIVRSFAVRHNLSFKGADRCLAWIIKRRRDRDSIAERRETSRAIADGFRMLGVE